MPGLFQTAVVEARVDEVPNSFELARIVALPRRVLNPADVPDATVLYRRSDAPSPAMSLWPLQSAALLEASVANGLFAPLGVGAGKTLITLLLPDAMGSDRAVLLLPSQLKLQLRARMIPEYQKHFKLPPVHDPYSFIRMRLPFPNGLYVVAYEELSSAKKADVLELIDPDLIIADECHRVRNRGTARCRRFLRFVSKHPETRFVGLSGSITTDSIRDYAHLINIALRKGSPLPWGFHEQLDWAGAIDVNPTCPMAPGALMQFCESGESVRSGYRRRLVETTGVVASVEGALGTSLRIVSRPLETPKEVTDIIESVRKNWKIHDEELEDGLAMSRILRQLSCGMYLKWVWPEKNGKPVKDYEWLDARAAWHKEVRYYLQHRAKAGMDSALLLAQAAASGRWESQHYAAWCAVKDRPQPKTTAVWISDFLVKDAVTWAKAQAKARLDDEDDGNYKSGGAIIWYYWKEVGRAIAEAGNLSLYDAERDPSFAKESIIVATMAHREGKNLQDRYSRCLITSPPSNGAIFEQLLGRLHRPGQLADEVVVDYYEHTVENTKALDDAIADAIYMEETTGARQKLRYADLIRGC